jgi:hypothetical protein
MSIRSQLEGKQFPEMGPFIDSLSVGVNEEIQAAIQPFAAQISQLSAEVAQLAQQVASIGGALSGLSASIDEIGSRPPVTVEAPPVTVTVTPPPTDTPTPTPDSTGTTPTPTPGSTGTTPTPTPGSTGTTPTPTPGSTGTTPTPIAKKYVSVVPSQTSVQLPNTQVNINGTFVSLPGEFISTPALLGVGRTDSQPDGIFVKDAVGSTVALSLSNIDSRVRFVGWEVGGQQVSTSTTYVLTVPDQDPVSIVARFVAATVAAPAPAPAPSPSPVPQTVNVSASLLLESGISGGTIRISGGGQRADGSRAATLNVPINTQVTVSVSGLISIRNTTTTYNGPAGTKLIRVGDSNTYTFTATQNSSVSANVRTVL